MSSKQNLLRTASVAVALGLGLAAGVQTGPALAAAQARTYAFDMPAQSLSRALRDYGRVTRQQLLFTEAQLGGRAAPALKATLSAEEALARLTAGTGLNFERTASGALVLRSEDRVGPQGDAAVAAHEPAEISEVTVTGSRLKQTSLDGPSPVSVFNNDKIERLGASGIGDVLRNLPQQSFALGENYMFGGSQAIQLRGLGLGTTLVLLNGRRTVSSGLNAARAFFDVNSIPLPAVDRIEVLSNSTSAVYGADAVGGVVNIILKSAIDRPTLEVSYGGAEGGAEEKRASLSFGHSTERFRSAVTLDWFERENLDSTKRSLLRSADFRPFGGQDFRSTAAAPANVFSLDGGPLPGLTSSQAAVPVGSAGVGLTPASFRATDGQLNYFSSATAGSIVTPTERKSAAASAEFDLTSDITAFGEFQITDRHELRYLSNPSATRVTVPANNPFNPFGQAVAVSYRFTQLGQVEDTSRARVRRGVLGLRGSLADWDWELSGTATHDRGDLQTRKGLNLAALNLALASTNPATAFNPFQDGKGTTDALLQSLVFDDAGGAVISSGKQIGGSASGALWTLPAGDLQVAIGAEARREHIGFNAYGIVFKADRDARAVFGELKLPLISPSMNVPLVKGLQVSAAARLDHYSDFGDTFNPQVGVQWDVTNAVLVRGSYGTSFRPPTLFELYQPQQRTILNSTDPRRGGEAFTADLLSAGNPNLDPESADSFSAGLVFHPLSLPALRVSVDYWRLKQDKRVQRFLTNLVLANEATFPERVVRATPTAADVAAGRPGRILSVDATSINFGAVETDGVDFQADYRFVTSAGDFSPSLSITYLHSFDAALFPNQPSVERAGMATPNEGARPHWKGAASLSWRREAFQASVNVRWVTAYNDATAAGVRIDRKIKPPPITDVQAAVDLGRLGLDLPGLDGTDVRIGVQNVFDKAPPFAIFASSLGYDYSQSDLRQRFIYVKLSKTF